MVPAQPELVDAFRSVRHRSIGEKVFTGRAGEPLSPQNHSPVDFGRDHRVATGTGVKGPPRHYLRHSRARQWLQSGLKVNGVSAWLGHSTVPGCQGTALRLPGRVRTLTQCPTARRSSRTSLLPRHFRCSVTAVDAILVGTDMQMHLSPCESGHLQGQYSGGLLDDYQP